MLISRQISNDEFIDDFYRTIMPGVIPCGEFIKWGQIDDTMSQFIPEADRLKAILSTNDNPFDSLVEFLSTSNNSLVSLRFLFRLLGHTGDSYVSLCDRVIIPEESRRINLKDESSISSVRNIARILIDIGIEKVLYSDVRALLLGVGVGLETHRRKNVGGNAFKHIVWDYLKECESELVQTYPKLHLETEVAIRYLNGRQSKNVDFAFLIGDKPVIGFEANFYTATGSKPTEIKRSYAQVRRDLEEVGVELVWITDGEGYMSMHKSLKDAQETHPNIYNFSMLKRYITNDVITYLKQKNY